MNKVGLFLKHVAPYQLQYNKNIVKNYFPLIRDRHNVQLALDIGCGAGDFTSELFRCLEQDIHEMIGIDISTTMVDWANKAYGGDRIHFSKVDVSQTIPEDFQDRFDCIFSFWALHWITNQRKVYYNVSKMLKQKGSFLVSYIASSKTHDIYNEVSKRKKYAPYISFLNGRQLPFQAFTNPQRELVKILEDVGFKDISCKVETVRFGNYTENDITGFFIALSPHYDHIPINLRMDFIRDHVLLVDTEQDANGQRHYYLDHTMFVAHGCKMPSLNKC